MKYLLISILSFSCFLYANNGGQKSTGYDTTQSVPQDLIYNKRYLDLINDKSKIRQVRKKDIVIDKELQDLNNVSLSSKPSKRLIKSIDEIYMHTRFPITLVFPDDFEVTYAKAFPKTIKPTKNLNIIDIEPTNKLLTTSLQVKYKKDGVPGAMTIIVNRYNKELALNKKDYILYPIINYLNFTPIEPVKVLEMYKRANNNKNPINNSSIVIRHDGNDIVYRFVEDFVNGYFTIANKKFLIEYTYKN